MCFSSRIITSQIRLLRITPIVLDRQPRGEVVAPGFERGEVVAPRVERGEVVAPRVERGEVVAPGLERWIKSPACFPL